MGTIAIALSGKPLFVWNGDEAAIKNILEAFPRGARGVGLTPQEFASTCIQHLSTGSLLSADPVGREMQMMGVIWHILESETGNAEHPGKIADYVSYTDFNVDIEIGDTDATAHVIARGKFDS